MDTTYPKNRKLKSFTLIDALFSEGKSVSKYPLRMVYLPLKEPDQHTQVGVSVSKKHFKKASDRNYFKRLLREAYRMNQHYLHPEGFPPYAFMLLYQTKDKLSFQEVQEKMVLLFEKFHKEFSKDYFRSNF